MATTERHLAFSGKLSLLFVLAMIETWVRSQECDVAIDRRQHCGSATVTSEEDCAAYEFCCYDPYVKPHCYIKRVSPLILYIRVYIIQDHLRDQLKAQVDQAFNIIQQDVDFNLDPVSSHVKLNALLEAFVSQSTLPNKLQYPACPLKIPLCMRTTCGPSGSNENPNLCYQDPRCCFDPDIAIYRGLFGEGFMANTPACYHGPTSGYFMKLANQLLPWNAFYQKTLVDLFEVTAQNNNYHAVCSLTLALSETVLKSPICGWEGITALECKLRDCCYNDKNGDCRYPNDRVFSGALNDLNIYPELKAESVDEAKCSAVRDIYAEAGDDPGLYRRIPCHRSRTTKRNLDMGENSDWCPRPTCCHDLNFESTFAQTLTARNFSADQTPDSGGGDADDVKPSRFQSYGPKITSRRTNSCPFFFVKHDTLPDLKSRLIGCCKQHACYHVKRFKRDQESRSTLTIDQDLRDLISYSFTNNVGDDPRSIPTQDDTEDSPSNAGQPPTTEIREQEEEEQAHTLPQIFNLGEEEEEVEDDSIAWEEWSMWSECSKTCGTGIKTKRRSCISDSGVDTTLCAGAGGDAFEATTCALNPCEPAQWTNWSVWSSCQAGCGFGRQFRLRRCVNTQGLDVNEKECMDGMAKEARACRGLSCAEWSQWSQYGGCNATCSRSGIEVRRRRCLLDGKPTPVCFGSAYEKRPCSIQGCPDGGTCSNPPCLIWTDWTSFISCSQTCRGGTQTLWRCQTMNGKCVQKTLEYKRISCNDEIECV